MAERTARWHDGRMGMLHIFAVGNDATHVANYPDPIVYPLVPDPSGIADLMTAPPSADKEKP